MEFSAALKNTIRVILQKCCVFLKCHFFSSATNTSYKHPTHHPNLHKLELLYNDFKKRCTIKMNIYIYVNQLPTVECNYQIKNVIVSESGKIFIFLYKKS